MLSEGDTGGNRSGMALESIESPPGTVRRKQGERVLFHGQARHAALQSQRLYVQRHTTRYLFQRWPMLGGSSKDKVPSPPSFMPPLKPYSHVKDQLKLYFTPCSFLKAKFHLELSHPCSTLGQTSPFSPIYMYSSSLQPIRKSPQDKDQCPTMPSMVLAA